MKVFGLGPSQNFALDLATALGLPLAAHEERVFEDSEFKLRPLESVRRETVVVCLSLQGDAQLSASDKLVRLLFFAGALKDAGARSVLAVVPYLAYARKDRRTQPRDPISSRYVAQLFEAMAIDAVVTADVHNISAFENAFRCGKELVSAEPIFVEHFASMLGAGEPIVVLSPDTGGSKRAQSFAEALARRLGRPVEQAFMAKYRSGGHVSGDLFAGEVTGANVIVLDDLISGGTTMARAARACRERGAQCVYAAATHGVFGQGAAGHLVGPDIECIAVTDSVSQVRERCPAIAAKLVVLPLAASFASALGRLTGLAV
jgi:ribose-phosphate pyrophosphokinase